MTETVTLPTHCDYKDYQKELKRVRTCIKGAAAVKRSAYDNLPHPSMVDKDSPRQQARYKEYLEGAEFDGQPGDTLQTMLGKMRLQNADIEAPASIEYMVSDSDGDGMAIDSAIEYVASNVLQVKWHVVVADYMGLSGVDLDTISIADQQEMNTRATLKHYTRENVINWHFSRSNGRMQLSWICLLERGSIFNHETYCHEDVESYLILALDENGDYYQQKILRGAGTDNGEGERNYIMVGGQPLKLIPLEVISDQETPSGHMPQGEGFLSKICNASLHKYQVSADYKETMKALKPTVMTKGWKQGDLDIFKELNGGRDYVVTGATEVNNLPRDVDYDVMSIETSMAPFEWYFTYADKKILSMGGTAKQEMSNMTATEADINASEQNAMLTTLADNLETCFDRLLNYCLMFEGGVSPDAVMKDNDLVTVQLPRDFATPKLSVEEVKALIELHQIGQMPDEELDAQLKQGGWRSKDFTIETLEEAPPVAPVNNNPPQG